MFWNKKNKQQEPVEEQCFHIWKDLSCEYLRKRLYTKVIVELTEKHEYWDYKQTKQYEAQKRDGGVTYYYAITQGCVKCAERRIEEIWVDSYQKDIYEKMALSDE